MTKELKEKFVKNLTDCLMYPETTSKEQWHQAEIINQKILNLIDEVIKQ